ncbi:MAG: hypothetical protein P1V81_13870 [Planctomycetota bacterium]|nr:hypothetical protein [Planctomycetota bacterium]
MTTRNFKRLTEDALLAVAVVDAAEASAVATAPGGCEGVRYPLFLTLEAAAQAELETGSHACIEFILPGRPGRWRAAGEVTLALPQGGGGMPPGVCLELLGLALIQDPAMAVDVTEDSELEDTSGGAPDGFDPRGIKLQGLDITGMLSDLLGRDVKAIAEPKIAREIPDLSVVAIYRDDAGEPRFAIVLDKPATARIGGALTMLPPEACTHDASGRAELAGEPLENATEVLNIMSALFHEAGSPHISLGETLGLARVRELEDEKLTAILERPCWSLGVGLDIEEYGPGELLLLAAPTS